MIGVFLRNKDDEICFVQMKQEKQAISSFLYTPHLRIMTVMLDNGEEEMITSEIAPEIHEALANLKEVLVAQMDHSGAITKEYSVKLACQA